MSAPTITQSQHDSAQDDNAPWWLILASTEAGEGVGARSRISDDDKLVIGRGTRVGDVALHDPRLSREHAELYVADDDRLWIKDLNSRNGTFVNERQIELHRLRVGDVVGIGALLFVVERHDPADDAGAHPTMVGLSAEHRCVLGQVRQVAALVAPVLIVGEVGTGKSFVARAIHDAGPRTGSVIELDCGSIPEAHVQTELFGWLKGAFAGADDDKTGLVERANGGTLLLDSLGSACVALQDCLASFAKRGTVRPLGADAATDVDVRLIATCHLSDLARLQPALRSAMSSWVIELPPLRELKIDIPVLAERFAGEKAGAPTRFHYRAMARLLRYDWPSNAQELLQVVDRAVVEAGEDRPIPMTESVAKLGLKEPADAPEPKDSASLTQMPAEALVVSFDGRWFRPPNADRVDLSRRHNLALILKALADRRRDQPGSALTVPEVLALGWPGVKVMEEAGNNRVYVALATLRKLGLAGVLERNDDGYLLSQDIPVLTHWGDA